MKAVCSWWIWYICKDVCEFQFIHLTFLYQNSAPPSGGAPRILLPRYRQVVISSSTIFAQRSMLSAAMCSYLPWKAKPPVHRFGVGRPM